MEIMTAIKNIRGKYNVDKKITVKHYLHEIKKNNVNEIQRYSLNVLLSVNRKVTKFNSRISYDGYSKIEDNVFIPLYNEAIEREKELISNIVKQLKPFENNDFDIKSVYKILLNDSWDLKNAIYKSIYFELFNTNDSGRIPMKHYVNPYSFYQISANKEIKERGAKFKSKIWFIDMILWSLSADNNSNGFLINSPTIFDVYTERFQKAILSSDFKMISSTEKVELIEEIENLLVKYQECILSK